MNYTVYFEYVDTEPFRPFRIQMASGRTYDIRHPENIRIGEHSVHVFMYPEQNQRVYERAVTLGYNLMKPKEHVDNPIAQD